MGKILSVLVILATILPSYSFKSVSECEERSTAVNGLVIVWVNEYRSVSEAIMKLRKNGYTPAGDTAVLSRLEKQDPQSLKYAKTIICISDTLKKSNPRQFPIMRHVEGNTFKMTGWEITIDLTSDEDYGILCKKS